MSADRPSPPAELSHLAKQRARARGERDFATADRLKAEIESAGWKMVDFGHDYRLEPAHPPNVEVDGTIRYGSSAGVPSRLDELDSAAVSVVLVSPIEPPADLPAGTQLISVIPEPAQELPAPAEATEVLAAAVPLGLAAAWNAGLRRAVGRSVVLVAPGSGLGRQELDQMLAALEAESVAVAGSHGLRSRDLRRWEPAPAGEVDALDAEALAFRRSDARARGPLDERLATTRLLAAWWSLVLRDEGPGQPARRAIATHAPLSRRNASEETVPPDRQARRDLYRLIDRFGSRYDLLREPIRPTAASAKDRHQRR
ncbi:MAG TPA: hypothetical protein VMP67_09930 [Candidatus Limnocylindria bacterium]|nr:hypothetical protein [Candidatus Limnocylindria bacterium]